MIFKERFQSINLEERMLLDFIKKCLGAPSDTDIDVLKADNDDLKKQHSELQRRIEALQREIESERAKQQ